MGRKFKFSKGFAKQEMIKRAADVCLEVYGVLHERVNDVNDQGRYSLEKRFNALTEEAISDVAKQEKQFVLAKSKMYVLRLIQIKRREKLLRWFEKYLKSIENKENKQVIKTYAFGLEKTYKDEIMNSFYDEFEDYSEIIEQLQSICGYVDLITQEAEEPTIIEEGEKEVQALNIDAEEIEPEEEQEKVEGENNSSLLVASEAQQEEKATKKEREKKEEESGEETSQKKAERFLQVAIS